MRFTLLAIGRLKASPEVDLVKRYCARLPKILTVLELEASGPTAAIRKERETFALLEAIPPGAVPFAFDERGQDLTTRAFHELLVAQSEIHGPHFAFLMGGAEGLDSEILPPALPKICLGRMTWPHAMARAMVAEQLYRVIQLVAQHPYHRD